MAPLTPEDIFPTGILGRLTQVLASHGVLVAYVFGSRVDSTSHDNSDYDIAVYLDNGHLPGDLLQIHDELRPLFEPHDLDIVILGRAGIALRFEIIKKGVIIFSQDYEQVTDFEDRAIRDYLDFEPFLRRFRQEVFEAILEEH